MDLILRAPWAFAFFLYCAISHGQDLPDYSTAIQQELARTNKTATCNGGTCTFVHKLPQNQRDLTVTIRYSSATATVYICIEKFLLLEKKESLTLPLATRLLELNREMIGSKLEWDQKAKAIRLSYTLNTDSNFDRKAFRGGLNGLLSNGNRIIEELTALAEQPLPPTRTEPPL